MLEWIDDINRFIFLEDDPKPADILFIPGNGHAEPSEWAAKLYLDGYAPLILPSGRYSITTGAFCGQQTGNRQYEGRFETEWAFMRTVLIENGVPDSAILCCMPVHARRAKMYYQTLYPNSELLLCPTPSAAITRINWTAEPEGIDAVLGELERCGSQFHDILREITL